MWLRGGAVGRGEHLERALGHRSEAEGADVKAVPQTGKQLCRHRPRVVGTARGERQAVAGRLFLSLTASRFLFTSEVLKGFEQGNPGLRVVVLVVL